MEANSLVARRGSSELTLPRAKRLLAAFGDERLVEQIRRGNDAAFEVVFDRYSRGILAFSRHMLASTEEAEDAVQHTFIQAYDAIRSGDRELKLKPWLYTIARNRCLSVLRARREQAAELDDVPTAGLPEEVQQRSELRDLLADIRDLPEDQRAALVLSEVGDLSHAEIATVVGCEASKVKSLVFQARSSLIESRNAREIPCHEIREQLATASGGALRRGPLRRHLKQCTGCAEFRDDVRRQRQMMAAALPVIPSIALKHGALAAIGIGGGGGAGASAGGSAAAGGLASLISTTGAGKTIALIAVAGATVGGGVAITQEVVDDGGGTGTAVPVDRAAPADGLRPHGSGGASSTAPGRHHGASGSARGHANSAPGTHSGRRGQEPQGQNGKGDGRANSHHNNPHAMGGPLPTPGSSDNVPGVNGNGEPLPAPSNGGDGGGNSGQRLGTDSAGGTPPTVAPNGKGRDESRTPDGPNANSSNDPQASQRGVLPDAAADVAVGRTVGRGI
jgi:RNA polymerase sigma factor (sigma-70 family)